MELRREALRLANYAGGSGEMIVHNAELFLDYLKKRN